MSSAPFSVVSASLPRLLPLVVALWSSAGVEEEDSWPAKAKLAAVVGAAARSRSFRAAVAPVEEAAVEQLIRDADIPDYQLRTVSSRRRTASLCSCALLH